jgi:pSer/pThr/pTyr-binding forkhead associated (FHA) protein
MLLVLSRAGVFRKALQESSRITIGRGVDCDVQVDDAKVSRHHITLEITDDVRIVDLGGRNGTFMGERRLVAGQPVAVRIGEPVTLGSTVLMVQSASIARELPLLSAAEFERRIEAARDARGEFALAHVRFHKVGAAESVTTRRSNVSADLYLAERLEGGLRDSIRPGDALAYIGPAEYQILFAGATAEASERLASSLRESLAAHKVPADVGLAVFPRDGRTSAELARSARASLRGLGAGTTSRAQLDRGALKRLAPLIERIAAGDINVLIVGETGVGKEVLAHTVHRRSRRAAAPMLCINCAALAGSLLESELFGHEKGAFTDAVEAKAGLLESADKGTLFLDEIGEVSLEVQAKLLRVLEEREVRRLGAVRSRVIDVRFIAATNRDLKLDIDAGRFRRDLHYRLNGITLSIPPLRERADEIEGLARAFVAQAAQTAGYRSVPRPER